MKSKNEMTLQKVTYTNSCQHAINLRRVHSGVQEYTMLLLSTKSVAIKSN